MRRTFVYRLDVTLPEGANAWDFTPENWQEPRWNGDPDDSTAFRWPRYDRLYLSASGAGKRAALLRLYGAKVEIVRSNPVDWPGVEGSDSEKKK